ncbi:hypothetical protein CS369_07180 [Candidatus Symbiopectobacterium sp. 'North America']|nr:hypothetical protein [Candidatus Symbiopectobacterium sp. 'North America']
MHNIKLRVVPDIVQLKPSIIISVVENERYTLASNNIINTSYSPINIRKNDVPSALGRMLNKVWKKSVIEIPDVEGKACQKVFKCDKKCVFIGWSPYNPPLTFFGQSGPR